MSPCEEENATVNLSSKASWQDILKGYVAPAWSRNLRKLASTPIEQNVGTLDALMRITVGLTTFGLALGRVPRALKPVLLTAGAMKVAEGVTRYCPVLALTGTHTLNSIIPQPLGVETASSLSYQHLPESGKEEITTRTALEWSGTRRPD